jgi:hypothetical protein
MLWQTPFILSAIMNHYVKYLQEEGKNEVDQITWEKVGCPHRQLYENNPKL